MNNVKHEGSQINVRITREKDEICSFALEDYIFGVVSSEIGNVHLEACKAQAVAARTIALPYLLSKSPIPDTNVQAFRKERIDKKQYPNAYAGVMETAGELLYFNGKAVSPCSFSASNGGKTTSSEARWGGARPYLIVHDDPYDYAVTKGKKTGHGVGMSQSGAIEMARRGFSYEEILSFYYPGTYIHKEESPLNVKASDLVSAFKTMVQEKWKYVAGGAKRGEVDCSGAFYYWYKQFGSYMYHGSNTMWHNYSTEKGKIKDMTLVPGMPVYKCRKWSSSQSSNRWYNSEPGDMYHVGCYIGDNLVAEAKGEKYGVVTSKLSKWTHASKLKNTDYNTGNDPEQGTEITAPTMSFPFVGEVHVQSGWLNLRESPSVSAMRVAKAYDKDLLNIVGETNDWYEIAYEDQTVYANKAYVAPVQTDTETVDEDEVYTFSIQVYGAAAKERLKQYLLDAEYIPEITEGG